MFGALRRHLVEEHALGWQGWAAGVLAPRIGMSPTWMDFWPTNGFLIVFGIAAAAVGWRAPGFALSLPAALLINAVFFHVLPSIAARLVILMAQKRFRYADV